MSKRVRFFIVIALLAVTVVFLYPTFQWYFVVNESEQRIASSSRNQIRDYAQQQARSDLNELKRLANEDPDKALPDKYSFLLKEAKNNYRIMDEAFPSVWTVEKVFEGFRDEGEVYAVLEEHYKDDVQSTKEMKSRILELGLDLSGGMRVVLQADEASLEERLGREPTGEDLNDAIDLSLEILNNRIDRFGVTEPNIQRQGNESIAIEIPGEPDPERVNSFLMGKGSLNFHIVDNDATDRMMTYEQNNPGYSLELDGTPDFIPAGSKVAEYVTKDAYGIDRHVRYIVIKEDITEHGLDGSHITEARTARDPLTNRPTVNFILDSEGAEKFFKLTEENEGESLAIVMDEKVRAYAIIQTVISNGQVRITGFDEDEARDIALVLRTAALPVDLQIIDSRAVGASLGEDSIRVGVRAIILGFILIIVFMLAYYKGAGIIADLALVLNLFFIVGILSVFNLTLTLTSIAGVILTVGMAVDANVIVFERIKEEYRLGKSASAAIKAGFQKAFWTVMDANITTFIAAVFLSQLASGPVQGFAVTLAVGIVSSMFTALFVSRLIFDFSTDVLKRSKLSISWRLR